MGTGGGQCTHVFDSDAILEAAAVPPDECGDSMWDCVAVGAVGAGDAVSAVVALMPLPPLRLMSSVFGIVLQLFG